MQSPGRHEELRGLLVHAGSLGVAADPLIGAVAVRDADLPDVDGLALPLALVVTGGAGQIAGPAAWCVRRMLPLASVTVALRDLDDPAGNARRVVAAVDAARGDGSLPEDVPVRVGLPADEAGHGWLAAADEIAAAELEAALAVSTEAGPVPRPILAGWLDAVLDRETAYAALGARDARDVLALLAATGAAWDGAAADDVVAILTADSHDLDGLATGRRWCRAVEVPDGEATAAELRRLAGR